MRRNGGMPDVFDSDSEKEDEAGAQGPVHSSSDMQSTPKAVRCGLVKTAGILNAMMISSSLLTLCRIILAGDELPGCFAAEEPESQQASRQEESAARAGKESRSKAC